MPHFQMLVGLPGCGKTTWVKLKDDHHAMVLSTDAAIERQAKVSGKTYNEEFKDWIKFAETSMNDKLELAVLNNFPIIWDQTNLSPKARKKKLAKIPKHYTKEAIIFLTSFDIIDIINNERKAIGRAIPQHILNSMKKNFDISTIDLEGFDKVTYVRREK